MVSVLGNGYGSDTSALTSVRITVSVTVSVQGLRLVFQVTVRLSIRVTPPVLKLHHERTYEGRDEG